MINLFKIISIPQLLTVPNYLRKSMINLFKIISIAVIASLVACAIAFISASFLEYLGINSKESSWLIPSILVVVGWFVNDYLNRNHEVAKRRLEHRLKMLKSFMPIYLSIVKNKDEKGGPLVADKTLSKKLDDALEDFYLLGHKDEIDLYADFSDGLKSKDGNKFWTALVSLRDLTRNRVRAELEITDSYK